RPRRTFPMPSENQHETGGQADNSGSDQRPVRTPSPRSPSPNHTGTQLGRGKREPRQVSDLFREPFERRPGLWETHLSVPRLLVEPKQGMGQLTLCRRVGTWNRVEWLFQNGQGPSWHPPQF